MDLPNGWQRLLSDVHFYWIEWGWLILTALFQQNKNDDEYNDGGDAAASKLFCSISSNDGSKEIVHTELRLM